MGEYDWKRDVLTVLNDPAGDVESAAAVHRLTAHLERLERVAEAVRRYEAHDSVGAQSDTESVHFAAVRAECREEWRAALRDLQEARHG